LTAEQQKIITEAAKAAASRQREVLRSKEDTWIDFLKTQGVRVTPPSEIDLSALDTKLVDIYAEYTKQIGGTFVGDLQAAARAN
jgi:TRAP-type C4-dicarboxylate transport system substrate-binding protein